jgi:adenylate cyclase class IV
MVQEIEIKALLSKEKYEALLKTLPQRFKQIEQDSITTFRFRPKDIRVRYSSKLFELVMKDGDVTDVSRVEHTINLKDEDACKKMISALRFLDFKDDPSWMKHKSEFVCNFKGHDYVLSLQHIENFAYLLEAEIIMDKHDDLHVQNLKELLKSLDCEPINTEEFKAKIQDYISNNSTI